MRTWKKLLAAAAAAAMVLGMSAVSYAQEIDTAKKTGGASITIENASKGVTYTLYKVFDATVNGGSSIAYTYTGELGSTDPFQKDAAGNVSVAAGGYVDSNSNGKYDEGEALSDSAITWIKSKGTKVTWTESGDTKESAVADGSKLVFKNLEYGYYYVTSSLQDNGAITVTSTAPNATIKDKNSKTPDWHNDDSKKGKLVAKGTDYTDFAESQEVNIGDIVKFQIKLDTSNYVKVTESGEDKYKQVVSYTVKDDLSSTNFELMTGTDYPVTVKVGDTALSATTNITGSSSTKEYSTTANTVFPITIPWVKDAASEGADRDNLYNAGSVITVEYYARLKDTAAIDGDGNKNTAAFEWKYADNSTDKPKDDDDKEVTDIATVYTYALALKKVSDKGTALKDAKFRLPFYVKTTAATDGAYVYAGTDAGEGLTNELTTPESGEITIKGMVPGTYSITETQAPSGYNKLTAAFSATAAKLSATTTTTTRYINASGEIIDTKTSEEPEVKYENTNLAASATFVVNKAGAKLPETGGTGTTLFYVFGALLAVGAGVVLVTRKRISTEI